MKAKEYFEEYSENIWNEYTNPNHPARADTKTQSDIKMFMAFVYEAKDLAEKRHAKLDTAIMSIICEQNAKWNAVCRLFESKYGISPIKKDGFKNGIMKEIERTSP